MGRPRATAGEASVGERAQGLPRRVAASLIAAIIATPIIGWWRIGDLSDATATPTTLKYKLRAPDLPSPLAAAVVVVVVGALAVSLLVLMTATVRRAMSGRRWAPLLVAMVAGTVLAWCGRVMTSGSVDTNIGAGVGLLVLVLGVLPLISLTLTLATWASMPGRVQTDQGEREAEEPM